MCYFGRVVQCDVKRSQRKRKNEPSGTHQNIKKMRLIRYARIVRLQDRKSDAARAQKFAYSAGTV